MDTPSKCGRCGSINPGGMKFCGMCGASLEAVVDPGGSVPRIGSQPAAAGREAAPGRPAASSAPAPAHTGGMFRLGAHDDHAPRSLDYLLEDDEPRSGPGPLVLGLVLALALASGLGYWHYRNGGWSAVKPAPAATADVPAGTGSTPSDNSASQAETASGSSGIAVGGTSAGGAPASGTSAGATTPPAAPPPGALTDVRPSNPAGGMSAATAGGPGNDVPAPAHPGKTTKPTADGAVAAASKPHASQPEPAAKAEDPVTQGEKYIYGRGLPQNCDRGLKMVKPSADQSNPKAMITMGALYATGHCVTRDLPTAYRYFALALRKDPENAALKQNVEMVWGQMTQSERQQAIRLTQ